MNSEPPPAVPSSGAPDGAPADAAGGRAIAMTVELPASADAVWTALTDGEELSRWFPLQARVTPGASGSVWMSWGPDFAFEAPITAWEPGRHLRVSEGTGPAGLPVAVDYYIEARGGGTTILRLVHSGFGADARWDDQYNATEGGWTYFLFNLRHYLARHAGTPRDMVWDRRPPRRSRAEVWRLLLGGGAYTPGGPAGGVSEGGRFTFALGAGAPSLSGTAAIVRPSSGHFAGVVEGLNDAAFFVELEGGPEDGWHCGVWLSTYGLPADQVRQLQSALTARLDELFGAAVAV